MHMSGAEPFTIWSGGEGCLLLHSLTSSPAEMRELGEYLANRDISVHAPLLAGHGTRPEDLIDAADWKEWLQSAMEGLDILTSRISGPIFLCGQSVGGLLSLYMAGEEEAAKDIKGVISIGSALYLRNWKISLFLPLVKHTFAGKIYRFDKPIAYDINDPEGREKIICYDRTPVKAVVSLVELKDIVRSRLSQVKVPVLAAHGGQDRTVPPGNLDVFAAELDPAEVETLLCPQSGHLVTMDYDRALLFERTYNFIKSF